jgi:hypothetical protein
MMVKRSIERIRDHVTNLVVLGWLSFCTNGLNQSLVMKTNPAATSPTASPIRSSTITCIL